MCGGAPLESSAAAARNTAETDLLFALHFFGHSHASFRIYYTTTTTYHM